MEFVVKSSRTPPRVLLGAVLVLAVVAIPLLLAYEVTRSAASRRSTQPPAVVSQAGLEAKAGVRVVRVAVSGDGGLLDLRYQVVDAQKAHAVHRAGNPPLLVDERTGGVVGQLLMGHIHNAPPKLGLTYYLIFLNPGELVRRGSLVSVVLGNARLRHVRVQ